MPIKLCFVGYGAIAQVHARMFGEEGATLDAVVGRLPQEIERFAAEYGFTYHTTDLQAALARPEIDAVVIASPSELHYEQARQALLAGKHALVEIPLAMSYAEGAELVELARRQGRKLMVAHSQRFNPVLAGLKQRVASGSLHLYHLVCRYGFLRRENVGWTGRRRSWTDNVLWHHGCHVVDYSLWLLAATRVDVLGQAGPRYPDTGTVMDVDILMRTPAGQLASLSLSYHNRLKADEYLLIGEEETVFYQQGKLYGPEGLREDPAALGHDLSDVAWRAQDREFLAALREDREPTVSGADALPALEVLQQVQDRYMPH